MHHPTYTLQYYLGRYLCNPPNTSTYLPNPTAIQYKLDPTIPLARTSKVHYLVRGTRPNYPASSAGFLPVGRMGCRTYEYIPYIAAPPRAPLGALSGPGPGPGPGQRRERGRRGLCTCHSSKKKWMPEYRTLHLFFQGSRTLKLGRSARPCGRLRPPSRYGRSKLCLTAARWV